MWSSVLFGRVASKECMKGTPALFKATAQTASLTANDTKSSRNFSKSSHHGINHDPLIPGIEPSSQTFSKNFKRMFKEMVPDLIRELTYDHSEINQRVNAHVAKCLQYNLVHGKMTRGLAVPISYRLMADDQSEEALRKACVLGWCVELMQAYFLVADDIMDGSITRRGQPCWYRKDNIGMMAINDALILESCIYELIDKHLSGDPYHQGAIDAFLKATRVTTLGQSLDMLSQFRPGVENWKVSMDDFNMNLCNEIHINKTAWYSFYFPVQLAMGLSGIKDPVVQQQTKRILIDIGKFFQVQDDYLDCCGDPEVTGKIGTDVEDGKCSWMVVMAMQRANPKQKEILKENYGRDDPENVAAVKGLYESLNLREVYAKFEEVEHNNILGLIQQLHQGGSKGSVSPDVFHFFLNKIHKRVK